MFSKTSKDKAFQFSMPPTSKAAIPPKSAKATGQAGQAGHPNRSNQQKASSATNRSISTPASGGTNRGAPSGGTNRGASPGSVKKTPSIPVKGAASSSQHAPSTKEKASEEGSPTLQVSAKPQKLVDRLCATLKTIMLFSDLDATLLPHIIAATVELACVTGQVIIAQGTLGRDLFLLDSGEYVVTTNATGDQVQKTYTGLGLQYFGELAVMYNAPRAATVTCSKEGTLYRLSRDTLDEIVSVQGAGGKTSFAQAKLTKLAEDQWKLAEEGQGQHRQLLADFAAGPALGALLQSKQMRIVDLVKEWDKNGDGTTHHPPAYSPRSH